MCDKSQIGIMSLEGHFKLPYKFIDLKPKVRTRKVVYSATPLIGHGVTTDVV